MTLFYFILGFITCVVILPLIESIMEVLLALLEIPKGYVMLKVTTLNNKIQDEQSKLEEVNTNAIGFIHNDCYDEYDDDDFEEDKAEIGFR